MVEKLGGVVMYMVEECTRVWILCVHCEIASPPMREANSISLYFTS